MAQSDKRPPPVDIENTSLIGKSGDFLHDDDDSDENDGDLAHAMSATKQKFGRSGGHLRQLSSDGSVETNSDAEDDDEEVEGVGIIRENPKLEFENVSLEEAAKQDNAPRANK